MLNKELCIKCHNTYAKVSFDDDFRKRVWKWNSVDELRWQEGEVYCPKEYVEKGEIWYRKITEQPPINCPFILEQTIY